MSFITTTFKITKDITYRKHNWLSLIFRVVIDPVAGSGATLRAAAEMNRHSYGFEIKKNFYKDAKEKMLSSIPMAISLKQVGL